MLDLKRVEGVNKVSSDQMLGSCDFQTLCGLLGVLHQGLPVLKSSFVFLNVFLVNLKSIVMSVSSALSLWLPACLSVCPPGFTHKTRALQCENLAIFNEVSKPRYRGLNQTNQSTGQGDDVIIITRQVRCHKTGPK